MFTRNPCWNPKVNQNDHQSLGHIGDMNTITEWDALQHDTRC